MFGKQEFAGPAETVGHRVGSGLWALLSFPHYSLPLFFAGISGDSSIPGTVRLYKFCLGERSTFLLESTGPSLFSALEIIHMPERHFGAASFAPQQRVFY